MGQNGTEPLINESIEAPVDLNYLRLFVFAAHSGSLSEAARRAGVPLPTLSRRVRALEEDLGVRLLERGPRRLGLTSAGTQLLADATEALESLAQAEQRLYDAAGVAGKLRLSVPPDLTPLWAVFSAFGQRHPAVRFDIFVTDRRVDLVADGVDVAIRVGDPGFASYFGRTVARYRHQLVASPGFLERHPLDTPAHLAAVPIACWRTAERAAWTLGETAVPLSPWLATNDYRHLESLALSGSVVTELPSFMARRHLESGQLVAVLPDHPMPQQQLRALAVEKRVMPPLIRELLDFVAREAPRVLEG